MVDPVAPPPRQRWLRVVRDGEVPGERLPADPPAGTAAAVLLGRRTVVG